MDQEIEIISSETRKEKIKNFIVNKKKKIIVSVIFVVFEVKLISCADY